MNEEVFEGQVIGETEVVFCEATSERRNAYIDSLRAFASFLEAHPNMALPSTQKVYVFPTVEEMPVYAREMGKCKKSGDDNYFNLTREFLPAIAYEPTWYRNQVCERVKVGEEVVQEDIVEVTGKRTVTREKFEWQCPKIFAPKLEEGV